MRDKVFGLALIAALAWTLSGCSRDAEGSVDASKGPDEKEETAVPVAATTVTVGSVYAAYAGSATLEAEDEADVVAKTSGVILKLLVEEGDQVEAGQVVALLDSDRLRLEVERAGAALARLNGEVARAKRLIERKLTSSDEYDRIRYEADAQRAAHAMAKLELSYAEVRTPIAGTITERLVKTGNLVQLHQTLYRVDDFDPLQAVLYVPERELKDLEPGQPATLLVDALGQSQYEGVVRRISPAVDAATGTVKVTVDVADAEARLLPGMFARVGIVHDRHDDVTVVPRGAIVIEDGKEYVFVLDEDRVRRALVKTGYSSDGNVEILEGVDQGARVVTSGKNSVADGALVEVVEEAA